MKASYLLFALGTLLGTAHAQTTPPTTRNPTPTQAKTIRAKTADRREATYTGPKVVNNSQELGKKMIQKSKPADGMMQVPVRK